LKYVKIKFNNIIKFYINKIQIFITILFVQIKIKLEQWRHWKMRRRLVVSRIIRPKRECTRITHLWYHVHDHLMVLFIISVESRSYFSVRWVIYCCKATLRAVRKFSVIVLECPYTRFLSGLPDDPVSIHKSGSKPGWVEGSSSYLSLNRLLYVSWKLKK
jgi:hypothetical protein